MADYCDEETKPDAVSGATPWREGTPFDPSLPAPGTPMSAEQERAKRLALEDGDPFDEKTDAIHENGMGSVSVAAGSSGDEVAERDPDAMTGATPGVAAACRELDMGSLDAVIEHFDINPPGVA